jgi:hypothetical protein
MTACPPRAVILTVPITARIFLSKAEKGLFADRRIKFVS